MGSIAKYPAVIKTMILSGQSLSAPIDIQDYQFVGIIMPASWTTANLTFQAAAAIDDVYQNVFDDTGAEVTVTAGAARAIPVATIKLAPFSYIKIRSGTSAAPVNQEANRTITLVLKD